MAVERHPAVTKNTYQTLVLEAWKTAMRPAVSHRLARATLDLRNRVWGYSEAT